jgi:hypothetical protein
LSSPLDAGPRLWSLGDYAAAIVALPASEQAKWLAMPVLLLVGDATDPVSRGADFEPVNTDVGHNALPDPTSAYPTLPPVTSRSTSDANARASLEPNRLMSPLIQSKLNLGATRLTVGRSRVCDVIVPLPSVSKVHAYLYEVHAEFGDIEDAGSRNGTFFRGARLEKGQRVHLLDGARILVGDAQVEFCSATRLRPALLSLGKAS